MLLYLFNRYVPRFRGKNRLVHYLLRISPFRYHRSFYGMLLQGIHRDVTYAFAISGAYGRFIVDIIRTQPTGSVFIDIGANIGLYSIYAAGSGNYEKVLAFEPNPLVYAKLVENIRLNKAKNIVAMCAAITSPGQSLHELWCESGHTGGGSLLVTRGEAVAVLSLDREFFDRLDLAGARNILVKIDVEGSETRVLEELLGSRLRPLIVGLIVEISLDHHGADGASRIPAMLEDAGFAARSESGTGGLKDVYFARADGKGRSTASR